MLTDRETRLRERIDWLTDQRDAALASLHKERAKVDRYKARVRYEASDRLIRSRLTEQVAALREKNERLHRELLGERAMRRLANSTTAAAGTDMRVSAPAAAEGTR